MRLARLVTTTIAVLVIAAGLYLVASRDTRAPRPSLLLVVMDTLRADRLGLYGYARPTSPRIDEFASSAVVYEAAISPAPFTMPAMAALMTGLYPDRVGVVNHTKADRLRPGTTTLAELLSTSGYRTGAVVTNPWLGMPAMGHRRGFQEFRTRRMLSKKRGRLSAESVTDQALDIIDGFGNRPFFVWAHYMDTHMPYEPDPEYLDALGDAGLESNIVQGFKNGRIKPRDLYFSEDVDADEVEATKRLYDAAVREVDDHVGRLLDGLRERGLDENTIVILASDHGESLGERGLYFAHDFTLYEELLRVPLVLKVPDTAPARIGAPVSLVDILPTLCGLLDMDCPGDLSGKALPTTPAAADSARVVFAAAAPARQRYDNSPWSHVEGIDGRSTMARTAGAKVIKSPLQDSVRWEAYDLTEDPEELADLGTGEDFAGLRSRLLDWEESMRSWRPRRRAGTGVAIEAEDLEDLRSFGYLH